jgi:hypothetical protein
MLTYKQFLFESKKVSLKNFVEFAQGELNLSDLPKIVVVNDPKFSIENKTFGCFTLNDNTITIQIAQRHPLDIYRTLAHEMVHYMQKKSGKELDGSDGSDCENEANATAAKIMRKYTKTINNHGY